MMTRRFAADFFEEVQLSRNEKRTNEMNMDKMPNVLELIRECTEKISDPAGREVHILRDESAFKLADKCQCKVRDIYITAMTAEICPYRYLRNRKIISIPEQIRLAKSRVAVVGSGGLGGNVILLLARMGIGHLVVIDHDVFDETNLNRQALSDIESIGQPKSERAAALVESINPAVEIDALQVEIDHSSAMKLFAGSDVIVDALDNIPDRFVLEKAAKKLHIPLVHGALAGFDGQLMTIFPEDPGLKSIYGDGDVEKNDPERPGAVLGAPALTPSIVATLQAMEVLKIILERGRPFRNTLVHLDLESGQFNQFSFEKES